MENGQQLTVISSVEYRKMLTGILLIISGDYNSTAMIGQKP